MVYIDEDLLFIDEDTANMKHKHKHVTYPEANRNKIGAKVIASNLVIQFLERAVGKKVCKN